MLWLCFTNPPSLCPTLRTKGLNDFILNSQDLIQFAKSLLYPNTIDYGKSARCGEGLLFLSIPPTLLDSSSTFLTFCPARVSRTVTKQTCVCVFPVQTDTLQL